MENVSVLDLEDSTPKWSSTSPRGGAIVMNRILKENATVPLFFAQTLISSLRDVGYNNTTSALCEHVDNSIESGASEVRIYIRQSGKPGHYRTDIAVYDNGPGMPPNVMKVASSFGGSMSFNNRKGIGRFGMGMKTAALSMSPIMELYSWQEPLAIYNLVLNVDEIGLEKINFVEVAEPTFAARLPQDIVDMLLRQMSYPRDAKSQDILAGNEEDLYARLGAHGTIVYMPDCDRLTYAKASTLADHAIKEMARIYRRMIAKGLKLYVNNRALEPVDPTFSMPAARHAKVEGLITNHSRLICGKQILIPDAEGSSHTYPVNIKLYKLPIEDWYGLPRKTLRNNLHVFDGFTVSILRNDRELFAGIIAELTTKHSVTHWFRLQIDFDGALDEAFGVASNKQGVRMKNYVLKAIKGAIGEDITAVINEIRRYQAQQASARNEAKPSSSELKASEADSLQAKQLADLTEDEKAQLTSNLRALAITLKRDGETDEQAFHRITASKYIITFKHDRYWPFYDVENRYGRIILTINTAHPFFSRLYEPVQKLSLLDQQDAADEAEGFVLSDNEEAPIVALDLLLLSLARTQSLLSDDSENAKLLEAFRIEWSEAYRIQLTV